MEGFNMRWKNGCLHKEDFYTVASAMNIINRMMMVPHMAGFTDDDGTDYYAVDMLYDREDVLDAIKVLNSFMNIKEDA